MEVKGIGCGMSVLKCWGCGQQLRVKGEKKDKYYMSSLKKNLYLNIYMPTYAYVYIGIYMA